MSGRREVLAFGIVLAAAVVGFLGDSLLGGKILSPADVVFVQSGFVEFRGPLYEPANRLLMDPVLQFEPWLAFSRAEIRRGRLPLWNPYVGCGAPHLANGQSAVFDPFHAIAYLGTLPDALVWMAAARLWTAGLGMFLLARAWGLGGWGRWFAGLTFPFCGFLVVWLLYPPASVAVWMPWLLLAGDRALSRPTPCRVAALALATALVLLGGHVQTSAHVLLAAGGWMVWRWARQRSEPLPRRGVRCWLGGTVLGVAMGAVAILPLGAYLARSPVWEDRQSEHASPWTIARPRLLETVCTVLPYAYGSQRRGHPHLAPALGVENLNESAGGFVGLTTVLWLAPLAWCVRRRDPRVRFLAILTLVGALGAFQIPPVANALRALPILDVIDHRRLSLWVALGLTLLGGIGLDHLAETPVSRGWNRWVACWALASLALLVAAVAVAWIGPRLRGRALVHYEQAGQTERSRGLADRQIRNLVSFLPGYYAASAVHGLSLVGLALAVRRQRVGPISARSLLLGLTLADLVAFGFGLNPAIDRDDVLPESRLIEHLRRVAPPPARILAIGAELPPNLLMRYGLADCRNYDSIELSRSLDWFEPLYEPEQGRGARSSRREISWSNVASTRDRLRTAGVAAVVGPTPPPQGVFASVERVGDVWLARLPEPPTPPPVVRAGRIWIDVRGVRDDRRMIPVTFDPGWKAELDGSPIRVQPHRGTFLSVAIPAGSRSLVLRYDPPEVRLALAVSGFGLFAVLCLAVIDLMRLRRESSRKKGSGPWMPAPHRVRIESTTSCWCPNRLSTEGRDADGPLHV